MSLKQVAIFITFLIASTLYANEGLTYGFDCGLGAGNLFGKFNPCSKYSIEFRINNFEIQTKFIDLQEMETRDTVSHQQFFEGGISSGIRLDINTYLKFTITCGIAYIFGNKRWGPPNAGTYNGVFKYEFDCKPYRTFGVPIELELSYLPLKVFGLGASINGNLNKPNPYIGFAVSAQCGKLR
jgi:hypothetical protein